MKLRGKILGVSEKCFYAVVLACTIGILLGSFFDFQINERLANVTKLGSFFGSLRSIIRIPTAAASCVSCCSITKPASRRRGFPS